MAEIDATVGGEDANAYLTEAEATTYFDERLDAGDWTSSLSDDRIRALIMATRRVDQSRFKGKKTDQDQALKWPRSDVLDEDGRAIATDVVPTGVRHATAEMALVLLGDEGFLAEDDLSQIESVEVGPIAVDFRSHIASGKLPSQVDRLLAPFTSGSSAGPKLVRA